MARTLTAAQITETAKTTGARPGYLVELGFDTTLRLTSFEGNVTWDSQTWVPSGLEVSGLSHRGRSAQQATLSLPDFDNAYFTIIRTDGLDDRTVKIWSVHGGPGAYAAADPEQLFDGFMDGARLGELVEIDLATQGNRVMNTPRIRIEPPVFNHLPPPGSRRSMKGVIWISAQAPE